MPLTEFYSAAAQLSFTLLGLWMAVVEIGPTRRLGDPAMRRTVLHISLGFLLPGLIALGSLLAVASLVMWRVAFGIGGVVGAVAATRMARSVRGPVPPAVWWASAVVYALFVVVATVRPTFELGGEPVGAITQEGMLVTIQLLLGAVAAWRVFAAPVAAPTAEAAPVAD